MGGAAGAKPPKPDIANQMILMLVFVVAIFIMFDQNLRQSLGAAVGVVLEPIVGFHGQNAVLTLFFTGLLMGLFSIVVRHFFVDWIEQARIARITSAFQKELREARLTNNTYKLKKLTELQPQIMSQSLKTSQTQMKLMPVTMLVIIPVFAWLANFVYIDDALGPMGLRCQHAGLERAPELGPVVFAANAAFHPSTAEESQVLQFQEEA